jgi:hypothetical protein
MHRFGRDLTPCVSMSDTRLANGCSHKKKGVTGVAQATTLQLNPASEGHNRYEKGNHQNKTPPLKACIAHSQMCVTCHLTCVYMMYIMCTSSVQYTHQRTGPTQQLRQWAAASGGQGQHLQDPGSWIHINGTGGGGQTEALSVYCYGLPRCCACEDQKLVNMAR